MAGKVPETKPMCFRIDVKNKKKIEQLAENSGLAPSTFIRFEVLKVIERSEASVSVL